MDSLAAAAGGAIGALIRFYVSDKLNRYFPYGTFLVNVIGSFCIGVLAARGLTPMLKTFWGTGVLGGLTTFSALQLETVMLMRQSKAAGLCYLAFTVLAGISACAAGYLFMI